VSAASIAAAANEITEEVDAITTPAPIPAVAPAATPELAAPLRPTPTAGERRVPLGVLRVIFGSIAALLALYWILVVVGRR
jgi:hypothetical protein